MGSQSDFKVMQAACDALAEFAVPFEVDIVSAHRTPEKMVSYARSAAGRGLKVIIAGAGGAAHLPGMVASLTVLPVIGVPVLSSNSLSGLDSILSILQMPAGVPVATVALDNARNAALLAVRILGCGEPRIQQQMEDFQKNQAERVLEQSAALHSSKNANLDGRDPFITGSNV